MADSKQNSPTNKNYTAGICQEMVSLRPVLVSGIFVKIN